MVPATNAHRSAATYQFRPIAEITWHLGRCSGTFGWRRIKGNAAKGHKRGACVLAIGPGGQWLLHLANGADVEVSVIDTGTGIPHEKLKDVFDTFYTTKQDGTGLGLSIARTIVETYGGTIWAENRSGGGAVVRFTLPLSGAHPA
jgi:nitrogen-specific signal transduction histidine kinase